MRETKNRMSQIKKVLCLLLALTFIVGCMAQSNVAYAKKKDKNGKKKAIEIAQMIDNYVKFLECDLNTSKTGICYYFPQYMEEFGDRTEKNAYIDNGEKEPIPYTYPLELVDVVFADAFYSYSNYTEGDEYMLNLADEVYNWAQEKYKINNEKEFDTNFAMDFNKVAECEKYFWNKYFKEENATKQADILNKIKAFKKKYPKSKYLKLFKKVNKIFKQLNKFYEKDYLQTAFSKRKYSEDGTYKEEDCYTSGYFYHLFGKCVNQFNDIISIYTLAWDKYY